ncbi:hypothetical protein JDV02_008102 [Purpureocillium takamizusanense]|uniref:Uncharacterized protein n=1 Tax=Purpureocillium takamizusanense TaxID=2060973 RepID=A0A9Q8VED7_9HYPO|nr:uncharacterized protein JDV02_008102 [Purpureocillium takamizusanense]UNI22191.1 hypothetical protein JDV02_008102 [Purpureocillium takamizusanense]
MTDHEENDEFSDLVSSRDAVPWPGDTFMIRERRNGRVLALADGQLCLEADISQAGNCHWLCVENNGWLGFRETELKRYLGHDFWWNFTADASRHDQYQYFQARRHPDGGYLLLAPRLGDLVQVTVGKDGNGLVTTKADGVTWEFMEV